MSSLYSHLIKCSDLSHGFLKGISPDVVTYTTLMKALIKAEELDQVQPSDPHSSSFILSLLLGTSGSTWIAICQFESS